MEWVDRLEIADSSHYSCLLLREEKKNNSEHCEDGVLGAALFTCQEAKGKRERERKGERKRYRMYECVLEIEKDSHRYRLNGVNNVRFGESYNIREREREKGRAQEIENV